MVGTGHHNLCAELLSGGAYFVGVGCHIHFAEHFNLAAVFIHPLDHGFATDQSERFLKETG